MRGATGVIVAIFLGLLAVIVNWIYLDNKTRDFDSVSFIGIRDGTTIEPGQVIQRQHLVEVRVPARHARNLKDFVYLWNDVETVIKVQATRSFEGGELFFRKDYVTPPTELQLEPSELVFWVTIDSNALVPELINPGDKISFHLPLLSVTGSATPDQRIEEVGPFRVKSLGSRLGSVEVTRAARRSTGQEQKIGLVIDQSDPEEMEQFRRIQDRILQGTLRNMTVTLHAQS